jgi:hypothetical protein
MNRITKRIAVPRIESSDRDADGALRVTVLAEFGRAAADAGTPDRGLDGDHSDAVDTIANVLHWAADCGLDTRAVLQSACRHFCAERRPVEPPPP